MFVHENHFNVKSILDLKVYMLTSLAPIHAIGVIVNACHEFKFVYF